MLFAEIRSEAVNTSEPSVSQENAEEKVEYLSPDDMRQWLRQEIADSAKALELRLKEATAFVTAYGAGKITPEEANEKQWQYLQRWGEPLPPRGASTSDEQILAAIDEFEGPYTTLKQNREKYRKLFRRSQSGPGF
jgi:hypothetical protein